MIEIVIPSLTDSNTPTWINACHKAKEAISRLHKGVAWRVTIDEIKPTRSENQNRLLWAVYEQIIRQGGEAMRGWSKEDLHSFFLMNHFGHEELNIFGKIKHVPLRRSSKLSKADFSDYVDSIVRFMAERGMVLSMPGDWND